jgi:hypothetical protein
MRRSPGMTLEFWVKQKTTEPGPRSSYAIVTVGVMNGTDLGKVDDTTYRQNAFTLTGRIPRAE